MVRAFGVRITYSQERELLGSAGAARQLDWFLGDRFVVLYGDVLTDVDLSRLESADRGFGGVGTLVLAENEDPTRSGIVQLDAAGRVIRFIEKPATDEFGRLANSGIYVLHRRVLDLVPPGTPFDFGSDLFPGAPSAAGLPLYGLASPDYVLDIGSLDRYRQAERPTFRLGPSDRMSPTCSSRLEWPDADRSLSGSAEPRRRRNRPARVLPAAWGPRDLDLDRSLHLCVRAIELRRFGPDHLIGLPDDVSPAAGAPLAWDGDLALPRAFLHHFGLDRGLSIFLASEVPPGTGWARRAPPRSHSPKPWVGWSD